MRFVLTCILLLAFFPSSAKTSDSPSLHGKHITAVIVKPGFINQAISGLWKAALKTRMSPEAIDSMARLERPLSVEEQEWQKLIMAKVSRWNGFRDSLGILFPQIQLPDTIQVLLGFQGNDDGFTYGNCTVCLDLTAMCRAYGKAGLPENDSRIDRIFAHEYTHLLHKNWAIKNNLLLSNFKD